MRVALLLRNAFCQLVFDLHSKLRSESNAIKESKSGREWESSREFRGSRVTDPTSRRSVAESGGPRFPSLSCSSSH